MKSLPGWERFFSDGQLAERRTGARRYNFGCDRRTRWAERRTGARRYSLGWDRRTKRLGGTADGGPPLRFGLALFIVKALI